MGMVFGVAIAGSTFSSRFDYLSRFFFVQGLNEAAVQTQAFEGAVKITFIVAAVLSCVAVFTSLIRGPLKASA
jgi:hypothetical protein